LPSIKRLPHNNIPSLNPCLIYHLLSAGIEEECSKALICPGAPLKIGSTAMMMKGGEQLMDIWDPGPFHVNSNFVPPERMKENWASIIRYNLHQ
jgi:hypothetical protein